MKGKDCKILFMGTYPPRQCGIATFTKDLFTAFNKKFPSMNARIIAMERKGLGPYNYSKDVLFKLDEEGIDQYVELAEKINKMDSVKLINIQHEFGIFGGEYGSHLIHFLKALKKPVIVTFHTVRDLPPRGRERIAQDIIDNCDIVIVVIDKAKELLQKRNEMGENKIIVVPHGIHSVDFGHPKKKKDFFQTDDKIILSTFGLLGAENKGLNYIIEALPPIIKKHSNVIYAILGAVHQDVLKANKGVPFEDLKTRIKELGLEKNVVFYTRYLDLDELLLALKETDIYLTPFVEKDRKSSGTLAYAMGCGKACISTPFYFAEDIIEDGENGFLVDFNDSEGFAYAINKLLDNPDLKAKFERRAYDKTRHMTWEKVVDNYYEIMVGLGVIK